MPVTAVDIPVRFIIDEFFIEEILRDKKSAIAIIELLSDIHRYSKQYPLCHNVIFDESFKKAIADKQIRGQGLLGAMHPTPYPSFVTIEEDFESKVIKYAINMANKNPYRIYILTSETQAVKYKDNPHYKSDPSIASTIPVLCNKEAKMIIRILHNLAFSQK